MLGLSHWYPIVLRRQKVISQQSTSFHIQTETCRQKVRCKWNLLGHCCGRYYHSSSNSNTSHHLDVCQYHALAKKRSEVRAIYLLE